METKEKEINNKRIAKNTIVLYIKMGFMMLFGILSSKLVLKYLGAEDYGIYNVVASIVIMFQFFNSALTSGTQRFLNYYLGINDKERLKTTFSQSFYLYIVLSLMVFVLSETIGVWLVNNYLNIPLGKIKDANYVYQFSIITSIFAIIRIPFTATIIAYEDMSFYAKLSITENILKFISILLLLIFDSNRLYMYSLFTFVSSFVLLLLYYFCCIKRYDMLCFKLIKNKSITAELFKFSWWNIFGSFANLLTSQGNSILINHYFDVISNAAIGLANSINGAVYSFLTSFQQAFNPQIVKLFARKDNYYLNDFCIKVSKYSFMLIYFIILPFIINCSSVLNFVYESVPNGTEDFIFHLCVFTIIDAINGPLWMLVEAEGNIKEYQIVGAINGIFTVVVMYICYDIGLPKYSGLVVKNISLIVFMIYRIFYLKKRVGFNIKKFIKETIVPILVVIVVSYPILIIINKIEIGEFYSFIISCTSSCILLFILYNIFMLNKNEKRKIYGFIINKIKNVV